MSPMLSVTTASTATEFIILPTLRLNMASQIFAAIEKTRTITAGTLKITVSGFVNLSIEVLTSSTPIIKIKNASVRAETYSILPWPNGCSSSAGLPEILKPTRLMTDETASKILFAPSATIEILFVRAPKTILKTERITFSAIPTTPLRIPKRILTFSESVFW